jgi:glycosyltransferase involved in cell wall biosynthesis
VKVSVIIDNYNYERYLREAIDSALAQTYPHTEVVVVDDGSTDGSREVIAAYGDRVVPVLKENGGQASAFNTGLSQASAFNTGLSASQGAVVLFLDADDSLVPDAVAQVVGYFDDPGVVKVHWPLWIVDDQGTRTGEVLPREPLPEGDFRERVVRDGPDSYLSMPTSGNAWSRAALERLLPLPEPDYRQGADGYLLTVTPLLGRIRAHPAPLGHYRVHGGNQFWSGTLAERIDRSLLRYERRFQSLRDILPRLGIEADAGQWRERNSYYQWLCRMRLALRELESVVPRTSRLILVDENEWGTRAIADREILPFLEHAGEYWGPPADDATAIAEVERMRREGAEFIAFAWPAFWWLEHYAGLVDHLRGHFGCLLENDRLAVFDLRS